MASMVPAIPSCANCGYKDVAYSCGRCEAEFYCGQACQAARWKVHKKVCCRKGNLPSQSVQADVNHCKPSSAIPSPTPASSSSATAAEPTLGAPELKEGMAVSAFFRLPDGGRSQHPMDGDCEQLIEEKVIVRFDFGVSMKIPYDWIVEVEGVAVTPNCDKDKTIAFDCQDHATVSTGSTSKAADDEVEDTENERLAQLRAEEKKRHFLLKMGHRIQTAKNKALKKEVQETRKQHAEQVREEEEKKKKERAEEMRFLEDERRRRVQEEQRKLREKQAEEREQQESKRRELEELRQQREDEKARHRAQEAELLRSVEEQKRQAIKAEQEKREEHERSNEAKWRVADEERRNVYAQLRQAAQQRLAEQRKADAERRRARLLARRSGMSWKKEMETAAKQREDDIQQSDIPDEVKTLIAERKARVEEIVARRSERDGLAEAARMRAYSLQNASKDDPEIAKRRMAERLAAIQAAARKRGMFWETELNKEGQTDGIGNVRAEMIKAMQKQGGSDSNQETEHEVESDSGQEGWVLADTLDASRSDPTSAVLIESENSNVENGTTAKERLRELLIRKVAMKQELFKQQQQQQKNDYYEESEEEPIQKDMIRRVGENRSDQDLDELEDDEGKDCKRDIIESNTSDDSLNEGNQRHEVHDNVQLSSDSQEDSKNKSDLTLPGSCQEASEEKSFHGLDETCQDHLQKIFAQNETIQAPPTALERKNQISEKDSQNEDKGGKDEEEEAENMEVEEDEVIQEGEEYSNEQDESEDVDDMRATHSSIKQRLKRVLLHRRAATTKGKDKSESEQEGGESEDHDEHEDESDSRSLHLAKERLWQMLLQRRDAKIQGTANAQEEAEIEDSINSGSDVKLKSRSEERMDSEVSDDCDEQEVMESSDDGKDQEAQKQKAKIVLKELLLKRRQESQNGELPAPSGDQQIEVSSSADSEDEDCFQHPPKLSGARGSNSTIWPYVPSDSEDDDDEDDDEDASFDALLRGLKMQIRGGTEPERPLEKHVSSLSGIPKHLPSTTKVNGERSAIAARTLELLEARRLAEMAAAGKGSYRRRKKNKNSINKRCDVYAVRRLMEEEEAAANRGPRFVNNTPIFLKKGERSVDVNRVKALEKGEKTGDRGVKKDDGTIDLTVKVQKTKSERIAEFQSSLR